jgi:hypothetical protein
MTKYNYALPDHLPDTAARQPAAASKFFDPADWQFDPVAR